MANALASMIQREQDTDREKRNALAPDINWVTPNVGQVVPKWVSTSDAPLYQYGRRNRSQGRSSTRKHDYGRTQGNPSIFEREHPGQ